MQSRDGSKGKKFDVVLENQCAMCSVIEDDKAGTRYNKA